MNKKTKAMRMTKTAIAVLVSGLFAHNIALANSGGEIAHVYGGSSTSGSANNNTVNISGGTINGGTGSPGVSTILISIPSYLTAQFFAKMVISHSLKIIGIHNTLIDHLIARKSRIDEAINQQALFFHDPHAQ